MKYLAFVLCMFFLSSQNIWAKWHYSKKLGGIYSVYMAKDNANWSVHVILLVSNSNVSFIATIPFSEYKKTFTLTPPEILSFKGKKLVKHDTFFFGPKGSAESINVDGIELNSFQKSNIANYKIINSGASYIDIVKSFKSGSTAKLGKHYWKNRKKKYPTFSLTGFTKMFNKYVGKPKNIQNPTISDMYPLSGLRCRKYGNRMAVWINTNTGTYALNGPAITWVTNAQKQGTPLIGSDGKEFKLGRDHIDHSITGHLISVGLKNCK